MVPVARKTTLMNHIWDACIPRDALCGALTPENYEPAMLPRRVSSCALCVFANWSSVCLHVQRR